MSVQAQIQEFSSGGVHISKNFDKQKKKNGKRENGIKTRVVVVLSLSQKLDFQTDFYRQLFTYKVFFLVGHVFCTIASPSLHKYTDDMVVLILFMCRGGGLGVLPQKFFFGLNDVKSCNSRQEKSENALS